MANKRQGNWISKGKRSLGRRHLLQSQRCLWLNFQFGLFVTRCPISFEFSTSRALHCCNGFSRSKTKQATSCSFLRLLTTRACGRKARLQDSLANRDQGLSAFGLIFSSYIWTQIGCFSAYRTINTIEHCWRFTPRVWFICRLSSVKDSNPADTADAEMRSTKVPSAAENPQLLKILELKVWSR